MFYNYFFQMSVNLNGNRKELMIRHDQGQKNSMTKHDQDQKNSRNLNLIKKGSVKLIVKILFFICFLHIYI